MKNMYVDCNVFLAPSSSALYRSVNGNTFSSISISLSKVIYSGIWYGAYNGTVYISTDDGLTWTVLAGIPSGTVNTLRVVGTVVYVGTSVDLYRYPDRYGALTFEPEYIGPINAVNVDLPGTVLAGGANGLYFSTDGFEWSSIPIAGLTGAVGVNSEILYRNGTLAFIGAVTGGYSVFYNTTGDALNEINWFRDSKLVTGPLGFTSATGWSVADATNIYQTPSFPSSWSTGVGHGLTGIGPVLSTTVYIRPPGTSSFSTTITRVGLGSGPVFTSPVNHVYFFNLYLKILPIHFVATNALYYFIDQTTLPIGMAFDPLTSTLSGTPMRILNNYNVTVFAKDANGYISSLTITLSVHVPYAGLPELVNASSYTAYLRDQVTINGATHGINNEVYPGAAVGPLMGPAPSPDVTNQVIPYCDPLEQKRTG